MSTRERGGSALLDTNIKVSTAGRKEGRRGMKKNKLV